MVAGDSESGPAAPVSWSAEQLNASGPVIGPGHRAFVPIVRSLPEGTTGDGFGGAGPVVAS